MSSTYVRFRDRGFEASDSTLEVLLALLVKEIDHLRDVPDWLRETRDEWYLQSTAGFGFGVIPGLDRFVTSDDRRQTILRIAASALEKLKAYGPVIPAETLNSLGTGGEGATFTQSAPATEFIRTARYFIKLLEGTLRPGESDSRFEMKTEGTS
jgi:hypothetical protein